MAGGPSGAAGEKPAGWRVASLSNKEEYNMWMDSTTLILGADMELQKPETTAERVQKLFTEWWGRRRGGATLKDEVYTLPVRIVDHIGVAGQPVPRDGELHFPKAKLADAQIAMLEGFSEADKKADEYILWGAGRAAGIALVPIPMADVGPLIANEGYMIYRVAEAYGYQIDKSVVAMLVGVAGGSIAGKLVATLLPFLKIPIAAGITYAVGKMAKAYFASGMTLPEGQLKEIFTKARKEADKINWREHAVEDPGDQK